MCQDDPCTCLPTLSGIQKDEQYWLEDGNLVLIAKNAIAFRVYKGLLARISPVFRDMLSMGQPDGAEMVDGCPVVHLSDDPCDFRAFLKLILDMPPR